MQPPSRLVLGAALILAAGTSIVAAETKPNVLFIVCDDLKTHVSPRGYGPIHDFKVADYPLLKGSRQRWLVGRSGRM